MKNNLKPLLNLFRENLILQRFFRVFSVDVFAKALNFLMTPAFLYLMTKSEYGTSSFLYMFIVTLSSILTLGFPTSLSKLYHDYPNPEKRGSLFFTLSVTLFLFLLLVFGIIYSFGLDTSLFNSMNSEKVDYQSYRPYIFVAIFALVYNLFLSCYFITSENIGKIQRYNIGRALFVNCVVVIALFYSNEDKIEVRLIATYVSELIVLVYFFRHCVKAMRLKFDFLLLKKALIISVPIMIMSIFSGINILADKYYVRKICGNLDYADYFNAVYFASVLNIIFTSFQNIWQPLLMKEKDLAKLKRMKNRYLKLILLISLVISICIWLTVWASIQLSIIPDNYKNALSILPLTLLNQILMILVVFFWNYLIYFEKTYMPMIVSAISSALLFPLFTFLIPKYGYYGASMSLIITGVMSISFCIYKVNHYFQTKSK